MDTMKLIGAVALLAGVLVLVSPAGAATKAQAFADAKDCLQHSGARPAFITRRADGGGFATFKSGPRMLGSSFWTYKTTLGQVRSVTVRYAGEPGLPDRWRIVIRHCLQRGI